MNSMLSRRTEYGPQMAPGRFGGCLYSGIQALCLGRAINGLLMGILKAIKPPHWDHFSRLGVVV